MRGHVTVLGAGVVGTSAALALRRAGFAVTLLDRDAPGAGCSSGNAGLLHSGSLVPLAMPGILREVPGMLRDPLGPLRIRPAYLPRLLPWGLRLLRAATAERAEAAAAALRGLTELSEAQWPVLLREAGAERLVAPRGELYVFRSRAGFDAMGAKRALMRRHGVPVEELGQHELRQMEPALARDIAFGHYLPRSRYVRDPRALTEAMAARLQAMGGEVRRATATALRREGARIAAVVTAEGEIPVERLVLATGAWTPRLLGPLGIAAPVEPLRGYHMMVDPGGLSLQGPVMDGERAVAVTPMLGGLRMAGTVEFAGLEAAPDWRRAEKLIEVARDLLPGLEARTGTPWMGHRPGTPDGLPLLGPAPGLGNLVLAAGHGQVGLALAAGTAAMVAALVAGERPPAEAAPFDPARFG